MQHPDTTEPAAWQLGYEIDHLRGIEARFAGYNAYSRTRFTEITTAAVARGLASGTMHADEVGCVDWSTVKVGGDIRAYPNGDITLGRRQPGDRIVRAFTTESPDVMADRLDDIGRGHPTWVWIWQESSDMRAIVHAAGYQFIGGKVTTAAEVRGLYFRDANVAPRRHPQIDPAEHLGIARTLLQVDVTDAVAELDGLEYADHYSGYNVRRSWSALSLRGYAPDPRFIVKPSEMSRAWKAEHEGEQFDLVDTTLRGQLAAVDRLHRPLTDIAEPQRIRLMRLKPGGGELRRHADLTDPQSGIEDGRVARFHFPLVTNPHVVFTSWDTRGRQHAVNMQAGECWYLDTRKPHGAINTGDVDRIHLVVDVFANDAVRALLDVTNNDK
jgi:hypothetical protein